MESILHFCITVWGGNARASDISKFDRIIRKAGKLSNDNFCDFDLLHFKSCYRKIKNIEEDTTHPLAKQEVNAMFT